MRSKIIILGSNGQLGSDLQKVFTQNGMEYIALTKQDIDFSCDDIVVKLDPYADAKYLINCVAVTNVDGCEDDPDTAMRVNASAVYQLAKWANSHDVTLIHLSTDYVFDGVEKKLYTEDTTAQPLSMYGLSKYAGDLAIQAYAKKYFIFRVASLFGVSGSSGKGGNFITTMLRLARDTTRNKLSVINDQYTTPTHTLDIARCIRHFIQREINSYGIYNCVSTTSCSWFEFTQQILECAGLDKNKVQPISYVEYNFKAKRPQNVILSTNKLSPIYSMPSWQAALDEYNNSLF